jgi:hypothetical protein
LSPGSERYKKVESFVQAFFDRFEELQKPPFRPKWKEVSLAAPLQGWKRFAAAQIWLDKHANTSAETRRKFDEFMAKRGSTDKSAAAAPDQNSALFAQFLEWQKASAAKQAAAPPLNAKKRTSRTTP